VADATIHGAIAHAGAYEGFSVFIAAVVLILLAFKRRHSVTRGAGRQNAKNERPRTSAQEQAGASFCTAPKYSHRGIEASAG